MPELEIIAIRPGGVWDWEIVYCYWSMAKGPAYAAADWSPGEIDFIRAVGLIGLCHQIPDPELSTTTR